MHGKVQVRHTRSADIGDLIALQKRIYPSITPWTEARFREQIETFPQGQIVAELNGQIVGAACSLIVLWDDWGPEHNWKEITAAGTFRTHDPSGYTLYGADVFVDTAIRRRGIGHALYEGRRTICRSLNLKRIIACGRLPNYHQFADRMAADLYAMKVVWGDIYDPVLRFQIGEGFQFCGVIDGYLPEDKDSCGYASIIVWLNKAFDRDKPRHFPEGGIL